MFGVFMALYFFFLYRRSITNFSSLITFIIECLNGCSFQWIDGAETNFQLVKQKMTEAPFLALPNFKKLFEVNYDTFRVGIEGVLNQDRCLIAFFSEKLSSLNKNYSIYDLEFYAIVHILKH
jgi:hypothetical protein